MKLNFKERLASLYLISTATIIGLLLLFIIFTIRQNVFRQLDQYLITEANKHQGDIIIDNDTILLNENAWMEREHQMLEINPVFVEIVDNNGKVIEKSPNLKNKKLQFFKHKNKILTSYRLDSIPIRQYQIQIIKNGKNYGYLIVGMSHQNARWIMRKLKRTLLIAFPIVLFILFFWARYIAGKSIKPVKDITETANLINQSNLKERIKLPEHKDELYLLAETINQLLDRIEKAIEREKQFTSDAAHELKTPLQVMKGNVEVLLRKPRKIEEYQKKMENCIKEIDRMSHLVDQLLLLARFESQQKAIDMKTVSLDEIIEQVIQKKLTQIKNKNIRFKFEIAQLGTVKTDAYLLHIILENIISNAIKYAPENGQIRIILENNNIRIGNSGQHIPKEELDKIFKRFYRFNPMDNPQIKGTGLGLSIVKRLCELLKIDLKVKSDDNWTEFSLII